MKNLLDEDRTQTDEQFAKKLDVTQLTTNIIKHIGKV